MRFSRMLVVLVALFIVLIKIGSAHAQHQYDRWYFGFKQGLNFRTNPPTMLSDGQTNTIEGSAVYSDPRTGDLLFYTDGSMVWDRLHRLMPSGKDLIADQSSTQAALIVPDPAEPKRFYLFHSDQSGYTRPTRGVYYSVVDLRRNGGYGDVTVKNQKLIHEGTEKLTAISICGGEAYWVIAHELITNNYVAWFVDANGVSPLPVKTSIGVNAGPSPVSGAGYLAASPNGQLVASVIPQPSNVEIFQFDAESGKLHDRIELPSISKSYGVSFSPNNSKLYVIGDRELAQYDLSQWDSTSIARSRFKIAHTNRSEGALRLGPDQKIYVQESDSLGVIHWPDMTGSACLYSPGVYALTPSGQFGLPNNIDALAGHDCKIPLARMTRNQTNICESTCIAFKDSSRYAPTGWLWLFEGASPSSSRAKDPTNICYSKEGSYDVTLIAYNDAGSDTIHSVVRVKSCPTPVIALKDTTLCISGCLNFADTSTNASSWQWTFENAQPPTFSGRTPGQVCFYRIGKQKVTLVAANQYGYATETAIVDVRDCTLPIAKFTHDSEVCADWELPFTNQWRQDGTTYEWHFEGGVPSLSYNKDPGRVYYQFPGEYGVTLIARNENGADTMSSRVRVITCFAPTANLNNYTICEGDCISLRDQSSGEPTFWEWKIAGGSIASSSLKDPGNVCFSTPGTFEIQLIVGNATGEDTATGYVHVLSATAEVSSSMILTEPLAACQPLDTAIWVTAGCKDAVIEEVAAKGGMSIGRVPKMIPAGTSVRIPVIIRHDEPASVETSITIKLHDRDLVVPCSYSVVAGAESFAYQFSEDPFIAGHCTPVSRVLIINNQACATQRIDNVRIASKDNESPFSTDFTFGTSVMPNAPREVTVTYDPTLPGSKEAQLIITTAHGTTTSFALRGIRNDLPIALIGIGPASAASVFAGAAFSIPVLFESAIGDTAAPSQLELRLGYNTDMLSISSIESASSWALLNSKEESGTLHLQFARTPAKVAEGEVIATLKFNSYLAEEESSTLSIEQIVCDPNDVNFVSCKLETNIGSINEVTVTGGCGVTELREVLKDSKSVGITVHPNPLMSTDDALTAHVTSTASETHSLPIRIELVSLLGDVRVLLTDATLRSTSVDLRLPLTDIPAGTYIVRCSVGQHSASRRIIVSR